jgi:NADP-dependent 3-hydroxy acid dehydrogenase YdfG
MSSSQSREQRRLACVWEADQAHVGEQLEPQSEPALLARQASLGKPWCLVGRPREPFVAPAPHAARGDGCSLPGPHEIVARLVVFHQHLGPRRNGQLQWFTVGAVPERPLSVATASGLEVRGAPVALEIAQRVVANEDHVAAATAVAAVGSAARHMRFAAEAETAIAAGSCLDVDASAVLHEMIVPMPDPVFLITGASSGIGAATARAATEAGYRVVLAARSADRLRELSDELGGEERALAVSCDVTEWEQQQALVDEALSRFGQLDVAFANAGFGAARGFEKESVEHWRAMVLTNVYGAALTIRATLAPLRESRGHLLLTGSVAGRRALPGSLYSATKWAVTAMGESARQELNGTGVRVTVIEPGLVDTPFFENPVSDALQADDVARAVMFAVSQPERMDVNEILVRPTAQEG